MSLMRHHFRLLEGNINPPVERRDLAAELPGEVREWLASHDFETVNPHTRLVGSYGRSTAILDIKDVDVLLFVPKSSLERTPNAVLLEVKRVLEDYPDSSIDTTGQRRSVRLVFQDPDLQLDIVPAVAEDGTENPLKVPDRPQEEWISSDPLGYGRLLSQANQDNGKHVVPLIKLFKAWRDVQMKIRRPKSYAMEVMVYDAVVKQSIELVGQSKARMVAQLFDHLATKYEELMDEGEGVPRIKDPCTGSIITKHWERSHFETFMRRVREAKAASVRALEADEEQDAEKASVQWAKVFGELWPEDEKAKAAAREEARNLGPGKTSITSTGIVVGGSGTIRSRSTKYYGEES